MVATSTTSPRTSSPEPDSVASEAAPENASSRPTVIVLNPTAGRGRAGRMWRSVSGELGCWPSMPQIVETQRAGHGTEIARAAVGRGAGLVVAAGGDGTAHEVVQGLMEGDAGASATAFAHVPLGTGCDLARGLGLPTRPEGILRGLRQGHEVHLDIGVADMCADAETVRRYFLNVATIGLGPAVALRVKRSRWLQRLGKHAYTLASLQEIIGARPRQVSWHTDDGRRGDTLLLQMFICNGPSIAGGMRPAPEASFDNGELHVVMAGPLSLSVALSQFRRLDRGIPFDHPQITSLACRSIDLDGAAIDVETDGEVAGGLPARLSLRPGGLLVRMPA